MMDFEHKTERSTTRLKVSLDKKNHLEVACNEPTDNKHHLTLYTIIHFVIVGFFPIVWDYLKELKHIFR
jgi:hypothetical protein